jgi:2-polyprenyl-3-methyl-5-hydroxy-6-metoxy-1,4-benzoquinol methylase
MIFLKRLKRFGKAASYDRLAYHNYQIQIGEYYLQNFVRPCRAGKRVLDIGCGEGGVLTPFERAGYECTGLEFSPERVNYAREQGSSNIKFIQGNIEEFSFNQKFDVVLMLDVIEHLNQKSQALLNIKKILSPKGIVIISFPPFRSPFGGHQQVMKSFLRYIPFIHLAPAWFYRWLLKKIECQNFESHFRNFKTGITIKQFERLTNQLGFKIIEKKNYFVRPRQAFRFGLKIKENRFKLLKEYLTTGVVYILGV